MCRGVARCNVDGLHSVSGEECSVCGGMGRCDLGECVVCVEGCVLCV